ncbi:HIT domain-containing protein [Segatella bryantii]|uniref:HIT domain-containing protein n=1 Tax=Segatella bryantii TaxID=77095 RepID=UPI003119A85A
MTISQTEGLSTNAMNRVFDMTTATYKFYWLLALLDMHVKEQMDEMQALDVAARMVAYAWYPTQYFRLSFGKGDSMSKIIPDVALLTGITVDDKLEDKSEAISNAISEDREVKKRVKILLNNVPFRFQKPWIDTTDDSEMQRRSQSFENDCLYSLTGSGEGLTVTINPRWSNYLTTNYEVLRDFALWNLTLFLQSKNPNLPNISGKLLRPEEREPLTRQKKFWNKVIEIGGPIRCIYKDTPLRRNEYDLDHFIPWSFVSHNQNWNLIPADGSFNSSKSNRIPDLDYYLPKMAKVQHKALRLYIPQSGKRDNTLDEYYALGCSPQDLMQMSDKLLYVRQKIDERFHPDGFNVGINVGEAAGQSVFHCHMHVIPRYKGDVPNPKGGVRGVIPSKQSYSTKKQPEKSLTSTKIPTSPISEVTPSNRREILIQTGDEERHKME